MNSGTAIWIFVGFYTISNLQNCYSYVHDRVKIVTYGEPCVASRQLPIKIEGPKPAVEEQRIPLSLDFRVASDMYVKPRRVEYPIAIDVPWSIPSPSERIILEDALRGKSYAYNTYVPPAVSVPTPPKNYNFAVDVPVSIKEITSEQPGERFVQRLRGLAARVDRVLVPACEVLSSYQC